MRKIIINLILFFLLFAAPAYASTPAQFSSLTEEEYARLMDNTLEWDEIQNLVTYFNPTYRQAADSLDTQKNDLTAACNTFRDEMNATVDTIDENLDTIEKQRDQLSMLPSAMVVDPSGATAGMMVMQLDQTSAMLKENRKQVKSAVSQGIGSISNILLKTEDSLRPAREQIAYAVEGLVISYRQLLINRSLVEKQISLYETMVNTKKAMLSQNMATEYDVTEAELSLLKARTTLAQVDNGLAQLRTAIGMQTGWSPENPPVIGAVPEPDLTYPDSVNKEEDYKKALENNKTYETQGKVSTYTGTTAVAQRDRAVNEANALASAKFDSLYDTMRSRKLLYEAASTTLERARLSKEKAERMKALGLVGEAEYEGLCFEYLSSEANAELSKLNLFQAINDYRWAVRGYMSY